jgi:hypothetical protein
MWVAMIKMHVLRGRVGWRRLVNDCRHFVVVVNVMPEVLAMTGQHSR